MAKRAAFISQHYFQSLRKAGFHFIARAFHREGWDVLFITAGISQLTRLGNSSRLGRPGIVFNKITEVGERLSSYAWLPPFHPVNLRYAALNALSTPIFRRYGDLPLGEAEAWLREADLVVFESNAGLLLFDKVKRLHPATRVIYRVSDDMRWLNLHPACLEAERRLAPRFDVISCPSPALYARFARFPAAVLHYHGIDHALFDGETRNPYGDGSIAPAKNAVFCGVGNLDVDVLATAASQFPTWTFHIIGPFSNLPAARNIVGYGELRMEDTVPYIKFADIGLNFLLERPHGEVMSDSLKMRQYTYCRLPIVAPEFINAFDKPHVMSYRPNDPATIRAALERAAAFDCAEIAAERILPWDSFVTAFTS